MNDLCPDLILDINLVLKLGPNTSFPELAWARSTRTARGQARLAHGRQPGSCGALYNECCLGPRVSFSGSCDTWASQHQLGPVTSTQ